MTAYAVLAHTTATEGDAAEWAIHTGRNALRDANAQADRWGKIYRFVFVRPVGDPV